MSPEPSLTLTAPDFAAAAVAVRNPGGFCWWYLDLVDDRGDGLVFIWSLGLPFLPGLRASSTGAKRPAIVLAVYRAGREALYLFQEYPLDAYAGDIERGWWRFGDSEIRLASEGSVEVAVHLNLPVPGERERLTGSIRATGALCTGAARGGGTHVWSPILAAANGSAEFSGAFTDSLSGRVYVDHNAGARPLHTLGISRWSWGRLAFPGREVVWYDVAGAGNTSLVAEIDATGRLRTMPRELSYPDATWSRYGVWTPRSVRFRDVEDRPVTVELTAVVDDSPFYQRHLVVGGCGTERARGVAEIVLPPRLDHAWFRPFVRMRVHDLSGSNALLLPWFSGSRAGRWGRLSGWGSRRMVGG